MHHPTETSARPLLETGKFLTGAIRGFVAILDRAASRVVIVGDDELGSWERGIDEEPALAEACAGLAGRDDTRNPRGNSTNWMPRRVRDWEGASDNLVSQLRLEDAPDCLLCVFNKPLGFSPEDEDSLNAFTALISKTIPIRRSIAPAGADGSRRVNALLAQTDRLASLGSLSAGVAHEINNHLSYVLFNVETLAEGLPELAQTIERVILTLGEFVSAREASRIIAETGLSKVMEIVSELSAPAAEALQGTHRVRKLVRDINTYSRADIDQVAPVSINAVLDTVLEMARNQCKYRAQVVRDYGEIPPIAANEGGLRQVFLNLLVNAAQAIEEGHVDTNELRISSCVEGSEILVRISDTGKGIDRVSFAHLFEPFFSTKASIVGSGLGLWVCRNIISNYGGSIEVTTELGHGSCFTVHLPLPPVNETEHISVAPTLDSCRARNEPASVLVVDDEPMIGSMLRRLLSREHTVTVVESGTQAQALLEARKHFDLIICDLIMPDISGMELYAWLVKNRPELTEQVIFMTGGSFTQRSREFLATTPNTYVEKPFDSSAVLAIVREHLNQAKLVQSRAG